MDFKKYADIVVNLQMKNEYYWMNKLFDDQMMDYIRERFDKESGAAFMQEFNQMQDESIRLRAEGVAPEGRRGQTFAGAYWNMINRFTGGEPHILAKLIEFSHSDGLAGAYARYGSGTAVCGLA